MRDASTGRIAVPASRVTLAFLARYQMMRALKNIVRGGVDSAPY